MSGLADLEAADPDFAVGDGEAHDVVDEGFGSAGAFRDAEDVRQELFDKDEVRGGVEGGVEGEDRARAAQAVAGEVEFGGRVDCFSRGRGQLLFCRRKGRGEGRERFVVVLTVLAVELESWSIWSLAHPYVEIFAFAGLEEENVVAVVHISQFVQLVQLGLGVEFDIFSAMWEENMEVVEEVPLPVGDAAGGEDKYSLFVLLNSSAVKSGRLRGQTRQGFVYCCHGCRAMKDMFKFSVLWQWLSIREALALMAPQLEYLYVVRFNFS